VARKLLLTLLFLLFGFELLLAGLAALLLFAGLDVLLLFAGLAGINGAIIVLIASVTTFVAVSAEGNSTLGIDGTGTLPPVKNIKIEKRT
jgi:hypothetical protein